MSELGAAVLGYVIGTAVTCLIIFFGYQIADARGEDLWS